MSARSFFSKQTIFLTGSTGHLGACLLHKLILVLKVQKVYVLIRSTPGQAIADWARLMPHQVFDILQSGKLHFISGDLAQPGLGIREDDIALMSASVTVVIHSAADISLKSSLKKAIQANCLPSLELARIATKFERMISFVQVSTLYSLSFLPDGPVEEKLYMVTDPEKRLTSIMNGEDRSFDDYVWAYAKSKHLTECLLTTRFPNLPIMILRPSIIGPAIHEPFELFGRFQSMPINSFYAMLMHPVDRPNLFHAAEGSRSGTNILDEIPVDLVVNVLLQHVQKGTLGPVHAGSQLYASRKLDDFISDVFTFTPERWRATIPPVEFTVDYNLQPCPISRFYGMVTRNWEFSGSKSQLDQHGPLGISLENHNAEEYIRKRVLYVFKETRKVVDMSTDKQQARL